MQNSYQHEYSSFDELFDVSGPTSIPKLSPLSNNGGGTLYPKTGITKTRRSSRASKKVPTTLLTADATNFRALVQQFTGYHSGSPTFGPHKGPINLNFEQYSYNSEKPEARSTWNMNEELEQSLVSFRANDVVATTTAFSDNRELFVSGSNHKNSRPESDPLNLDEFDIDNFSLQEMMSGAGTSTITTEDDLWGYSI